ncbi:hypothetical protein Vadar_006362 [Vaccinium darrowii]|uniref:Uncharacterized protein n=1 Tax=Vaccinium darrowii TaxID=229202 RepID=A0ACB7YKT3_9ERIC|nr:hypothetical protein Vadar_006362 [Vaccinium darrowii]
MACFTIHQQLRFFQCVSVIFFFLAVAAFLLKTPENCNGGPSNNLIITNGGISQRSSTPALDLTITDLQGRPLFVFGDSTVDAGNFRITTRPYGIDYKTATPRFTNGRTIADDLAEKMGTPIPQAFNSLGADDQHININFASGGCGLLTKTNPLPCTSMSDQVIQMINARVGNVERARAVYFISVGANDIVFSFQSFPGTRNEFADVLVSKMESYMKLLFFSGGARIFVVNNLAPIGCIPDKFNGSSCDDNLNEVAEAFNIRLESALNKFRKDYGAAIFLANSTKMFAQILEHPEKFGFKNTTGPCCGEWKALENRFDCGKNSSYCGDRDEFVFFDGAHSTEAANKLFVDYCLSGRVCSPLGNV